MANGLAHWAFAFAFTQAIEVPIYRRLLGVKSLVAFGASALTHPVVWFVMPRIADALFAWMSRENIGAVHDATFRWLCFAVLAEGFAVLAEALYFKAFRAPRPLLGSLLANAASALLGYLCWSLTGWP